MSKKTKLFVAPSKIHGLGLFAGENLKWGARLIEFKGERIKAKEAKRRERFYESIGFLCMLELDDRHYIDGTVGGNESRFINSSKKGNVGALRERGKIIFYSLDDIDKGEELTFDYGFDPRKIKEPRGRG